MINPTETKQHDIPTIMTSFQNMLRAAGKDASALKRSFLYTSMSAVFQGLSFVCLYPLFDALLVSQNQEQALLWFMVLLGFTMLELVFRWCAHNFGYSEKLPNVTHNLRVRIGLHLRRIPLGVLSDKRTGEISTVIAGNVDEVITPMGNVAEMYLRSLIVPFVIVLATFVVSWQLALALALLLPMVIPIYRWRRRASGQTMRFVEQAHQQSTAEMIEYTQGLAVLRSANAAGEKAKKLRQALLNLQRVQRQSQLKGVLPNLMLWSLIEGGIVLVMGLGVYLILSADLTIAALSVLLIISVRLSESIAIITNISAVLDYMETGLKKIDEFLALKPLTFKDAEVPDERFDFCLDNVSFGYQDQTHQELNDVSLFIPERSMTALVGPSGAGKTTLIRMLMRYADPQKGRVLLGGKDLKQLNPDLIMQKISVVFQDVYLFDDSILNNIRMAKPNATNEEVEAAAKAAYCHDFITRMPQGYETSIGEIGGTLSGGERQRISIARAILKDAPIVILDEPTAALDTQSERAVQRAIDGLVLNRTVIVIAHRLSTITAADQIVVLDDGEIVQLGQHEQLIQQSGRYQSMWQAQQDVKHWHLSSANVQTFASEPA